MLNVILLYVNKVIHLLFDEEALENIKSLLFNQKNEMNKV